MNSARSELPRAFAAFFGRFGRLKPVQERAIPAILAGDDVLIVAPTATGKTEAYAAPLAERYLASPAPAGVPHAIFVAPTRALTNDLFRRLAPPFEHLGISFGRYTGEHKERAEGSLPAFVVTTPEALDALLARCAQTLAAVRAVVVDELHILDNTPRGDQLRFLLHRLSQLVRLPLQRLAASATVSEPQVVAQRYLESPQVIEEHSGQRTVRARCFLGRDPHDVAQHLNELATAGFRKILIFVNSRKDVELLASYLNHHSRFRDAVFPHHGSLSRTTRLRTEERFQQAGAAVAVATLTLELGIDIGTVDYVLLCGVPPNISSLLQRIGRGSRRSGQICVGYACAHRGEEFLYRFFLQKGMRGELYPPAYALRTSVLVQQALAIAGAEHFVTVPRLCQILPPALAPAFPPERLRRILDCLVEHELLESPRLGRYVLGPKGESRYEYGRIHSNIEDPSGVTVVDRISGEILGMVDYRHLDGTEFSLAGRTRRPYAIQVDRILTDPKEACANTVFPVVQAPQVSFSLARAVAAELGAGPDEMLVARRGDHWLVLHGLGSCEVKLVFTGPEVAVRSPYLVALASRPHKPPRPSAVELRQRVSKQLEELEKALAMGCYRRFLPQEERIQAVAEALDLERLTDFLEAAQLRIVPSEAPSLWANLLGVHAELLPSKDMHLRV